MHKLALEVKNHSTNLALGRNLLLELLCLLSINNAILVILIECDRMGNIRVNGFENS